MYSSICWFLFKVLVLCIFFFFWIHCREYGELLVSCGLIGEAVKTFEDLELWDNLIFCYRYDRHDSFVNWKSPTCINFYFSTLYPNSLMWAIILKQPIGEESSSCWTNQETTFWNTQWPQVMVCVLSFHWWIVLTYQEISFLMLVK